MNKSVTTIRLNPEQRSAVIRQAHKSGLSFSSVVQMLLQGYLDGSIQLGVAQQKPLQVSKPQPVAANATKRAVKKHVAAVKNAKTKARVEKKSTFSRLFGI